MRHDTPPPLYTPVQILDDPPPFLQLRTYNGLFLNEKTNNYIRISYSLKYKHSKKKIILYEKINGSVGQNEGGTVLVKNPIVQCQLCLARGLLL